ncbi:TATA box-binding protein-associated factor RNA polymerase I subunit B [Pimephales promelas]|uniref:TATA box-binding protein-associated factor RNA polymerase I subunit B n=1 Tax=Pimephales promelas TaxID=90988 RepID=UPI0019554B41|nr:TATA box-binding protein-associated factor RNA polymerase I subunit B [Pimephales promelas]KAG1964076.1 TATA box-binding protein-associated factor RNA polymerase I subunit B [Pimephales promelas]
MDELVDGFSEPCRQCAAVEWGVSDGGHFFCKNCHNVIEKTREVVDSTALHSKNSRISQIKKPKRKRSEDEREWMVCEGFQFILKLQAKALVSLGVCLKFETEVLWNFWKKYLQNTRQAFTENTIYTRRFTVYMKPKSEPESDTQSEMSFHSTAVSSETELSVSGDTTDVQSSLCSEAYLHTSTLMNMPRTLALCYLALLWVREAITLADLLRLVSERRVPYMDIQDAFPEEMRLFGKDIHIFQVWHLPSYSTVHREAFNLAQIMQLPSFPTVSQDCLLHPLTLSVRYMLDANLPDALHIWVHRVIRGAAMDDESYLTFDPKTDNPGLLRYEIQAAAVIIVAMKLLFKLDDHAEWKLSEEAAKKKKTIFRLKRWFAIVQPVLEKARQNEEHIEALRRWKPTNPFITSLQQKSLILKKRRVADYLEQRFHKLTDSAPEQLPSTTNPYSSFRFSWGNEEGSDGPSMYDRRLDCTFKKNGVKYLANRKYWHPELRRCVKNSCGNHFPEMEPWLPRMYVWVLDLFSFILGVRQAEVYQEVLNVERRFLSRNHQSKIKWTYNSLTKKKGKKSKTATRVAKNKITDTTDSA